MYIAEADSDDELSEEGMEPHTPLEGSHRTIELGMMASRPKGNPQCSGGTHGIGADSRRTTAGGTPAPSRPFFEPEEGPAPTTGMDTPRAESPVVGIERDASRERPGGEAVPTRSLDDIVALRLMKLFDAQDRNASESEILKLRQQLEFAREMATPKAVGIPIQDRSRSAQETAARTLSALRKVTPPPKLGSELRPPHAAGVQQWKRNIESTFEMVQIFEDSVTRTRWALSTIQYTIHRELLERKIKEGSIATWADLHREVAGLVQDPVLTKFDNYLRFFNLSWRDSDTVDSFLLALSNKESLLTDKFFKNPDNSPNEALKIAFVWSKAPETLRREVQRLMILTEDQDWATFERNLKSAEKALEAEKAARSESTHNRKRNASQAQTKPPSQWKRPDRRQSQGARSVTPSRPEGNPQGSQREGGDDKPSFGFRPRPNDRGGAPEQRNGRRGHWKQQGPATGSNATPNLTHEQGKGKP